MLLLTINNYREACREVWQLVLLILQVLHKPQTPGYSAKNTHNVSYNDFYVQNIGFSSNSNFSRSSKIQNLWYFLNYIYKLIDSSALLTYPVNTFFHEQTISQNIVCTFETGNKKLLPPCLSYCRLSCYFI